MSVRVSDGGLGSRESTVLVTVAVLVCRLSLVRKRCLVRMQTFGLSGSAVGLLVSGSLWSTGKDGAVLFRVWCSRCQSPLVWMFVVAAGVWSCGVDGVRQCG